MRGIAERRVSSFVYLRSVRTGRSEGDESGENEKEPGGKGRGQMALSDNEKLRR